MSNEVTENGSVPSAATSHLRTPARIGWSSAHSRRDRPHLRRDPLRVYATRAVIWDFIAIIVAGVTGFVLRWAIPFNVEINDPTYVSLVVIVVLAWMAVMALRGAYDTRILGVGSEEFKRVVSASATVFGAVAIVVFALKLDLSRGFVLITFVVGLTLLLIVRWSLRAWLRHERRYGHFLHRTVVIGAEPQKSEVIDMLDRDPAAGFTVVDDVEEPAADISEDALDAWLDEIMALIALGDADTVAIAGSPAIGPRVVQRLAWRLEGPRVDLLVAPAVGDVAGPRVSMRMAADLPLLHLDEPHLTGPKRAIKRAFDVVAGLFMFFVFLPFMIVAAIGVRFTSRGSIFYMQERVGRGGQLCQRRVNVGQGRRGRGTGRGAGEGRGGCSESKGRGSHLYHQRIRTVVVVVAAAAALGLIHGNLPPTTLALLHQKPATASHKLHLGALFEQVVGTGSRRSSSRPNRRRQQRPPARHRRCATATKSQSSHP